MGACDAWEGATHGRVRRKRGWKGSTVWKNSMGERSLGALSSGTPGIMLIPGILLISERCDNSDGLLNMSGFCGTPREPSSIPPAGRPHEHSGGVVSPTRRDEQRSNVVARRLLVSDRELLHRDRPRVIAVRLLEQLVDLRWGTVIV